MCGKVFHMPEGQTCPIYYCCRSKHGYQSCGECASLPCETILAMRDPSFSDEKFAKNVEERVKRLKG